MGIFQRYKRVKFYSALAKAAKIGDYSHLRRMFLEDLQRTGSSADACEAAVKAFEYIDPITADVPLKFQRDERRKATAYLIQAVACTWPVMMAKPTRTNTFELRSGQAPGMVQMAVLLTNLVHERSAEREMFGGVGQMMSIIDHIAIGTSTPDAQQLKSEQEEAETFL